MIAKRTEQFKSIKVIKIKNSEKKPKHKNKTKILIEGSRI